ncbi:hypothetical protein B296_00049014, partial [Ensete ventricosum]
LHTTAGRLYPQAGIATLERSSLLQVGAAPTSERRPCGLAAITAPATWLRAVAPCERPLSRPGRRRSPLQMTLAACVRPYRGASHSRSPMQGTCSQVVAPFLTAFDTKMQQKYVEQFYAIQSHHT